MNFLCFKELHMLEKTQFGVHIRIPDEIRRSPIQLVSELKKILDEVVKNRIGRILYEINDPTTQLNGSELVEFSNLLADQIDFELRAAVFSPNYNKHMTATFIENLLISKKIMTKYFNDKNEAIDWLSAD